LFETNLNYSYLSQVQSKCSNVADLKNGRLISSRESYNVGDESG